jgi:WD40 repeat protein
VFSLRRKFYIGFICNTGVKIDPQNGNLVYSGSLDATIKLWDLRSNTVNKPVATFEEAKDGGKSQPKPFTAFDVNCAGMFIAAGTEQVNLASMF